MFGTGSAQFQPVGSSSVLMKYSVNSLEDFTHSDERNFVSVINGHKTFFTPGDYSNFTVRDYLWKYPNSSSVLTNYYKNLHADCYFWYPFRW